MINFGAKGLLSFALISALIGLFLIIFLADHLEPEITSISEVDERNLDQIVKVQGQIERITEYESLTILSVDDETGRIEIIFYDNLELEEENKIEVIGKVVEYKGKIEIEANKIKILE